MSSVAEMIPILLWWQGEMIKQMESSSTHLITGGWQNYSVEEFIKIIERNIELLKSTYLPRGRDPPLYYFLTVNSK